MADGIVQVAPDSTGKKVDTSELTVGANTVERQRVVLADPSSPTGLAPVTAANGALVDVSRVQGAVTIFNGTVDSGNSSTTPLAANGVFTGAWLDCFNQGSVLIYLFSNVSSAANGLSLQWSNDGVNADETYAETFTAGSRALVMQVTQRGRYFRLVYTNGATLQASFRLNVIHKITTPSGDVEELSDVLSLDDHGMITIPILAAKNAAGSAISYLTQAAAAPAGTEVGLITRNIPSGTQTIQGVQDTATSGNIIASTTVVGPLAVTQRNVVTISIRGTYAGVTFIIEASDDGGTSWFPLQVIDNSTGQAGATWTPGTNASASYDAAIGGFTHVRVRATAWTSGSGVVTLTAQSFAYDPVVAAISQGLAATGTAVKGFPVLGGGSDGTNVRTFRVDASGNQGVIQAVGTAATRWYMQISDGTNSPAIKAASTAAAAADPSIVAALSPNSGLPVTTQATNACSVGLASALTVANIKASAGNVMGVAVTNPNASIIYLQFYNTAGTPTLGTSVIWWIPIPASGTVFLPPGTFALANHATGIGIGASTTPTSTGTPGSAPSVVVFYK